MLHCVLDVIKAELTEEMTVKQMIKTTSEYATLMCSSILSSILCIHITRGLHY